jgi:hypothetical protein
MDQWQTYSSPSTETAWCTRGGCKITASSASAPDRSLTEAAAKSCSQRRAVGVKVSHHIRGIEANEFDRRDSQWQKHIPTKHRQSRRRRAAAPLRAVAGHAAVVLQRRAVKILHPMHPLVYWCHRHRPRTPLRAARLHANTNTTKTSSARMAGMKRYRIIQAAPSTAS